MRPSPHWCKFCVLCLHYTPSDLYDWKSPRICLFSLQTRRQGAVLLVWLTWVLVESVAYVYVTGAMRLVHFHHLTDDDDDGLGRVFLPLITDAPRCGGYCGVHVVRGVVLVMQLTDFRSQVVNHAGPGLLWGIGPGHWGRWHYPWFSGWSFWLSWIDSMKANMKSSTESSPGWDVAT